MHNWLMMSGFNACSKSVATLCRRILGEAACRNSLRPKRDAAARPSQNEHRRKYGLSVENVVAKVKEQLTAARAASDTGKLALGRAGSHAHKKAAFGFKRGFVCL